ncbi:MAG: universal stress protein [Actinomycetota bacterium]|nr:universal stress protein [Actinomycetota bacterium]
MRGTILCGVDDSDDGRSALELAAELSERLGARLVLVHVADGLPPAGAAGDESVTTRASREGAARLLTRLAAEHGVAGSAEQRSAVGDPAALLGQIAAEEAADMIIVGARARGRLRRGLESRLVRELETETPVPVLIAPPRRRRARQTAA